MGEFTPSRWTVVVAMAMAIGAACDPPPDERAATRTPEVTGEQTSGAAPDPEGLEAEDGPGAPVERHGDDRHGEGDGHEGEDGDADEDDAADDGDPRTEAGADDGAEGDVPEWQTCERARDCTYVVTDCCRPVAARRTHRDAVQRRLGLSQCDMVCGEFRTTCREGRCRVTGGRPAPSGDPSGGLGPGPDPGG